MTPLFPHQQATLDWLIHRGGSGAIFWDPGTGKTRFCLEAFTQLRIKIPTLRLFVVAPLSIVEPVWKEETLKYTAHTWTSIKQLNPKADIWCGNFESVIRTTMQRRLETAGLWRTPVMLIIDESSRCKNYRSLTTKTLLALAERCQFRLCCSGTPMPNGMHEAWAQIRIVDPGIFPRSYFIWRRTYFYLGRNGHSIAEPPPSRQ